MSDPNLLSLVANLLRPVSREVAKGKDKLCLSTVYLQKLNKAFDENVPEDLTSSFHLSEAKASLQIDLQFLLDLVKATAALKVAPDLVENENCDVVNLKRFENIKTLEIHKINIKNVIGIQKLRSHIEDLTCTYTLINLEEVLDKCGGDFSQKYIWSELKRVNFSHNRIRDIESSFELTPWLQTLDLSHNYVRNVLAIDNLPNLKRLNLSYNKLERIPKFKGQICKRLQVLLLNNNFIEDISGLSTLSDLLQLDLAQNCLVDHNALLSVSHMASLYSLDLRGNPISFHRLHRTLACNYLNKNTTTLNFILDNIPLTKAEKSLSGSLYPLSQGSLGSNGSYSSQNSLDNSVQDRQRRVRNVKIQEASEVQIIREKKMSDSITPSPRSNDRTHLDVKSRIEQLRSEYGEKWLSQESGEIIQGVLKLPETPKLLSSTPSKDILSLFSSSPNLSNISDRCDNDQNTNSNPDSCVENEENANNDAHETCILKTDGSIENSEDDDGIYANAKGEATPDAPSDDDDLVDGEIFVGSTVPDQDDLCIVLTDTHLSERDSVTTQEKARWHINVVKTCQHGDGANEVKIEFDTLRSDRMSRTYYMEDAEKFIKLVLGGMQKYQVPVTKIQYQCMKCNFVFSRTRKCSSVLEEQKVTCSKCDSNLVIESK